MLDSQYCVCNTDCVVTQRDKQRAHKAVFTALRRGELKKASRCEHCNSEGPLQAHHEDYSHPLKVVWLCARCHTAKHKEKRDRPTRSKARDDEIRRPQPFSLRVSEESLEIYRHVAEEANLSLSEWARLVLDSASGASELPEQLTRVVKFEKKVRDGKW